MSFLRLISPERLATTLYLKLKTDKLNTVIRGFLKGPLNLSLFSLKSTNDDF